ncbi:MAG: tRNA pseudouridine(38-40) synthase TruA [bacterium]
MSQRKYRLDLRYDGTDFCGWQVQKNQRSVESVLLKAIHTILPDRPSLHVAGRTDAGVHAEHQVAQFLADTAMSCEELYRGINSCLPHDVAVTSIREVPSEWNARRDALRRTYRYSILNSRQRDPLLHRTTYWVSRPLDTQAMSQAAEVFVGEHDFSAFRSIRCDATNPVRRITATALLQDGDHIHFWIEGYAFLRHMVRTMAGTLIEVGRGKLSPGDVRSILEGRDRSAAGPTAPAHALTLVRVTYADEISPLCNCGFRNSDCGI